MRLEYQIILAVGLDFVLGDPRFVPHPVRGIGRLASWLEQRGRMTIKNEMLAGTAVALCTLFFTVSGTALFIWICGILNPALGDLASIIMIYTAIAIKDLVKHSKEVYYALAEHNLELARNKTAMMVGRKTSDLDEGELVRAAVESIAENMVDGVIAPLFYALMLGPLGAIGYRAVNTLDSMFGYKDARYEQFGKFSARLDDVSNFIPARVGGLTVPLVAQLLGFKARKSWQILWRDRRQHDSPNAGWPEAAFAGALGVRLGGTNVYGSRVSVKPYLGDPLEPLNTVHIRYANRLMVCAALTFLVSGVVLRLVLTAI